MTEAESEYKELNVGKRNQTPGTLLERSLASTRPRPRSFVCLELAGYAVGGKWCCGCVGPRGHRQTNLIFTAVSLAALPDLTCLPCTGRRWLPTADALPLENEWSAARRSLFVNLSQSLCTAADMGYQS